MKPVLKLDCRRIGHEWKGCVCTRCSEKRNKGHVWDGCVCRVCGKKRDEGHIPTEKDEGGVKTTVCEKCGKNL